MVAAAAAAPGRTVGVVFTPGAVLLPWSNNSNVSAAIAMFLPGLEGGHAVADVVFGDVNPTGRLPVTFPNRENEVRQLQPSLLSMMHPRHPLTDAVDPLVVTD